MGCRILTLNNNCGDSFQLEVDDAESFRFEDIISALYDEVEENKFRFSGFSGLQYCYKMEAYDLETDQDVKNMFTRQGECKNIVIWIGERDEPSMVFKLAKKRGL